MKWKCKDGRVLDIQSMTTDHLKNTISMLRRNKFITPDEYLDMLSCAYSFQGEMAQYYAEQDLGNYSPSNTLAYMEETLNGRTR